MTPAPARLTQTGTGTYRLDLDSSVRLRDTEITVVVGIRSTGDADSAPPSDSRSWTPPTTVASQEDPTLTAYEHALSMLVTAESYGRYGRSLIHGLMHCEPQAVVAAASMVRAALSYQP